MPVMRQHGSWLREWCEYADGTPGEFCEAYRGQCRRHLADLDRSGPDWPYRYDEDRGLAVAVDLQSFCLDRDVPLVLEDWQLAATLTFFGWVNEQGLRRFWRVFMLGGKGMGKTPLMAAWMLILCCMEGERRAEGFIFAQNFEQAGVPMRDLQAIVDHTPGLRRSLGLHVHPVNEPKWCRHEETKSWIQRVSTTQTGKGKSAPRPHAVFGDELQAQTSDAQLRQLALGSKGRAQPAVLLAANAGLVESVAGREYTAMKRVALGEADQPTYLPVICEVDSEEEAFGEEAERLGRLGRGPWLKAQPTLVERPGIPYVVRFLEEAKASPAARAINGTLIWGLWANAEDTEDAVSPEFWRACQLEPGDRRLDPEATEGGRICVGVDLSERWDLTAAVWVEEVDPGSYVAGSKFWTPEHDLDKRALNDDAPYREWIADGYLDLVPGDHVDYRAVAVFLGAVHATGRLSAVAIDPYRSDRLVEVMRDLGIPAWKETRYQRSGVGIRLVPHPQATAKWGGTGLWMPGSIEETLALGSGGKLKVEHNPVLQWGALGTRLRRDFALNLFPAKDRSRSKIDGFVGLVMGVGMQRRILPPETLDPLAGYFRRREFANR